MKGTATQSLPGAERPDSLRDDTGLTAYEVRVLRTIDQLNDFRDAWRNWQWHPNGDFDFYAMILETKPGRLAPFCLAVLLNNHPVALLAGRSELADEQLSLGYLKLFKLKARRLTFFWGGLMGEITPAIAQALVTSIVHALRDERHDLAALGPIPVDSALYKAAQSLPNWLMRGYSRPTSLHWRMTVPPNKEEFLRRRSKKHRYWLNRIVKTLDADFKDRVRIKMFTEETELLHLCRDLEEVSRISYQRKLGAGFVNNEEFQRRFLFTARAKTLRALVLYIDSQPKAFWAGTLYRNVFYLGWTGYDPSLRGYELGTIVFLRLLEQLGQEQVNQIDFGLGNALYKERFGDISWTDGTPSIFSPTLRGVALNCSRTATSEVARAARWLLRKLNAELWLKRLWRRNIALA